MSDSTHVEDTAAYIISQMHSMTAMKLQKLCYYSHAWSLVLRDSPLFSNRIEAWANGPVVRDLYRKHRLQYMIDETSNLGGAPNALSDGQRQVIDAVLRSYGDFSAEELSRLSHSEAPWIDAREGLPEGSRGTAPITDAALMDFFSTPVV